MLPSVIIPARNEADRLGSQLEALASQDYSASFEVIIVDNGSTDDTVGVAGTYGERIAGLRIVSAPESRGINYVRNVGTDAARGKALLFCDADDVVSSRWVSAMVEALGEFDAVGGPLDVDLLNPPDIPARTLRSPPPDDRLRVSNGFLPTVMGCNFALRSDVIRALGGFNETYARGADETELLWRMQLAGYSVGFAPEAVVHYRYRRGVGETLRQLYGYYCAQPQLYRQFRPYGFSRRPITEVLRSLAWVALKLPYVMHSRERRLLWLRQAVKIWGRLAGSFQSRTFYL